MEKILVGVDRFMSMGKGPTDLVLHQKRGLLLKDIFEDQTALRVEEWGDTFDTQPHEYVEISVAIVSAAAGHLVTGPMLKWVADKLAEKLTSEVISETVKWLFEKLYKKQEREELKGFKIVLEDGTVIESSSDKDDSENGQKITITLSGDSRTVFVTAKRPSNQSGS